MEGGEDKIRYSDIIQPDDSIEKLVRQLGDLTKQYEVMINAIRAGADRITQALKATSGATTEGRKSIEDAAASTSRLEHAQKELKFALSETGKQVAWLKAQTADANKTTVEQQRYIKQAISSYDRLKSDLQEMVGLYKSLTQAERDDSQMGKQLLVDIQNLVRQIQALDAAMKPHIQTLSEVEKAEQKLAYLQSEEGQQLLTLRAKIAEITAARKQQKAAIDPLATAQEKLTFAQSRSNWELKLYTQRISEANRIAKLQAQIATSAEGSYNRLSAQYELNKIRLNQMSGAQREAADEGKKLEAETKALYEQMRKLQEATGNYRLSVGHYQKAWDGLGVSVSNVIRELPAATVSMNTFFLGISNNVPMLIDQINLMIAKNKQLAAQGKATVSIFKAISSSMFKFSNIIVLVLSLLAMFADDIVAWVKGMAAASKGALSMAEAMKKINEELKSTNADYGASVVQLKRLTDEWAKLKTEAEKTQWIEDNKSAFQELGIAIFNATDAENAFVDNTDDVLLAFQLRAKAAAAEKLAIEQYEAAFTKRAEAETIRQTGPTTWNKFIAYGLGKGGVAPEQMQEETIASLERQAEAAEKTGDAYYKLAAGYTASANAALEGAGLTGSGGTGEAGGDGNRDLTDRIYRTSLAVKKKYMQSETALITDEYEKRKAAARDNASAQKRELEETQRQLQDYISDTENKYKNLTAEERAMVEQSLEQIQLTIKNIDVALAQELNSIEAQAALASLDQWQAYQREKFGAEKHTEVEITRFRLEQEKERWEKQLQLAQQGWIRWTQAQIDAAKASVESINRELANLTRDEQIAELTVAEETIQLRLEAVKKGSAEELELRKQAIEKAREKAILENKKLPASEQQSEINITASFDKQLYALLAEYEMTAFDQQQALDEARFNSVQRSEKQITRFKLIQEKERWKKQIQLAEAGGLDWSQAQIDTAKAMVDGIDRELREVKGFRGFLASWSENGLGGSILETMGFDEDAISALGSAVDTVVGYLQEIADAEVELAEKAVEAAEERVSAAQSAYDAEIEARNNGYANNVATAKKELEQEKKKQREKQKLLEQAQKRQEALNTIMQASSLITASANLWSSFSSVPIAGPILAAAAIAAMFTSFAFAKVKARQVTASSEEYGEGGLEFLEGGSHASGNDIDLGTNNRKGKRMRAEGGEALAIISKKQTRKYRKVLPDVIDSLNKGTFEDKYLNAFGGSSGLNISFNSDSNIDLSKIETDVQSIKKQNEVRYYSLPNGSVVVQRKNIKRIIKN